MSATGWRVREAGEGDADALALVGAATFLDGFAGVINSAALLAHCARHHTAHAYRSLFANGACAWLGEAEPGGAPVGYALLSASDIPGAAPGDVEVKRIYTLHRFHGSGLADVLMAAVVDRARASSARRLLLGVKKDNARAIRFYEKRGFEAFGDRRFQVGDQIFEDVTLALQL